MCGKVLGINRQTVAAYLDADKLYKHKWNFSSLSVEQLSKWVVSPETLDAVNGDLLGDGHISSGTGDRLKYPNVHCRLQFTFSAQNLPYLRYLKFVVYAPLCTNSEPTPWPIPELTGKAATQYWFSTKQLPMLTELHKVWYKYVEGKFVKILPSNMYELLNPIGIAQWIMGDGYLGDNTLRLCTDNFTKEEVLILLDVLDKKFGIKATLNKRTKDNGVFADELGLVNIVWIS